MDASRIAWDPGIGFGKTVAQNFALLARQRELYAADLPFPYYVTTPAAQSGVSPSYAAKVAIPHGAVRSTARPNASSAWPASHSCGGH